MKTGHQNFPESEVTSLNVLFQQSKDIQFTKIYKRVNQQIFTFELEPQIFWHLCFITQPQSG